MEKNKEKTIIIAAIVFTLAAIIIITVAGFAAGNKKYEPSGWVLKTYGNTVALYNHGEIETIFGEIVIDDLPPDDVSILENGIAFPTREEAVKAIEDYE